MRFSQRIGKTPEKKLAQIDSMDEELRNSLWSLLHSFYLNTATHGHGRSLSDLDSPMGPSSSIRNLIFRLWVDFYKKPIDTIPDYWGDCKAILRKYFFSAAWFEAYDFLEFVALNGDEGVDQDFKKACNHMLERENSAYRFIGTQLAGITSTLEIEAVEDAISSGKRFAGVSQHLDAALRLMSDRNSPDFRNSIKESISAVESLAKHITGKPNATLGEALKELERQRQLHSSMKKAFSALYGYTSSTQGIRHALMDEPTLTKTDARFMLICCSAFINFAVDTQIAPLPTDAEQTKTTEKGEHPKE